MDWAIVISELKRTSDAHEAVAANASKAHDTRLSAATTASVIRALAMALEAGEGERPSFRDPCVTSDAEWDAYRELLSK